MWCIKNVSGIPSSCCGINLSLQELRSWFYIGEHGVHHVLWIGVVSVQKWVMKGHIDKTSLQPDRGSSLLNASNIVEYDSHTCDMGYVPSANTTVSKRWSCCHKHHGKHHVVCKCLTCSSAYWQINKVQWSSNYSVFAVHVIQWRSTNGHFVLLIRT